MDAGDDARTIGARLRRIRVSRGKSQRVVAELAGISYSTLSRIENGLRALDSRSEIVALAKVLEISPSELTRLPVPAPADGNADSATDVVRLALMAVNHGQPDGRVTAVDVLRARVLAMLDARCRCDRQDQAAATLPDLIRDVHTSISVGRDVAKLLDVTVLLHTQGTGGWLRVVGAPLDLRSQATALAHQAARERDEPIALGIATVGSVGVMLSAGAFDLAQTALDSVTVPTASQAATELAHRTGEGNAYWMGFGPTNVGLWHLAGAVELGDYERAVATAEALNPKVHPNRTRQAAYWVDYGRALARVRRRGADAVMAFRRAETISRIHLHRNPLAREVLAELLTRRASLPDPIQRSCGVWPIGPVCRGRRASQSGGGYAARLC